MSAGRPVQAVAPVASNKPQRVVYRTLCEKHGIEYGREMVPSTQQHESYLTGNCPRCEEDVRIGEQWKEKVLSLTAEVKAETDQFCAAEEGRQERLIEMKDALKNEDRAKRAEEFFQREDSHFASRDADYLAFADSQDRARIDSEIIERRRVEFFELQRGIKAEADAELQKKLDADRERRATAALASWVPL